MNVGKNVNEKKNVKKNANANVDKSVNVKESKNVSVSVSVDMDENDENEEVNKRYHVIENDDVESDTSDMRNVARRDIARRRRDVNEIVIESVNVDANENENNNVLLDMTVGKDAKHKKRKMTTREFF